MCRSLYGLCTERCRCDADFQKLCSQHRELNSWKLCSRQGIELLRYGRFQPLDGKDMCDRILCLLKASIRRYCSEGQDLQRHAYRFERETYRSWSVCIVQEQNSTPEMNKNDNFNSLHNLEFNQESLRVWRAFNVGPYMFIVS